MLIVSKLKNGQLHQANRHNFMTYSERLQFTHSSFFCITISSVHMMCTQNAHLYMYTIYLLLIIIDFNFSILFTVLEETLVPTTNVMPSEKATSLGSRTCHRSRDSLLTPSHAMTNIKSKSLSSLGSLDTDVIELQNHMTFGQGVKVCYLFMIRAITIMMSGC